MRCAPGSPRRTGSARPVATASSCPSRNGPAGGWPMRGASGTNKRPRVRRQGAEAARAPSQGCEGPPGRGGAAAGLQRQARGHRGRRAPVRPTGTLRALVDRCLGHGQRREAPPRAEERPRPALRRRPEPRGRSGDPDGGVRRSAAGERRKWQSAVAERVREEREQSEEICHRRGTATPGPSGGRAEAHRGGPGGGDFEFHSPSVSCPRPCSWIPRLTNVWEAHGNLQDGTSSTLGATTDTLAGSRALRC